jgi:hypothetical protein
MALRLNGQWKDDFPNAKVLVAQLKPGDAFRISSRAARRIADVRLLGGDAAGARRYYAEAISEARDLGAEREEGLAALGLGRAHLELRRVGEARRLAQIAIDLLERCGAPSEEIGAALALRGTETQVTHEEHGA